MGRAQSLGRTEGLRAYWQSPEPVFLIVEHGMLSEARAVIGERPPLVEREIGANRVYLFRNR